MRFKQTYGIVTDLEDSNPAVEADVIMTATALGLAASYVKEGISIRFDMDPKDKLKDPIEWEKFKVTVGKLDTAVVAFLKKNNMEPMGEVNAGTAPDFSKGAVIMGIYRLAGQTGPISVSDPVLSKKGQVLYEQIKNGSVPQYTGRGAYTGFVDNNNTEGDTDPVGPRSTARFLSPTPGNGSAVGAHPRWLPRSESRYWSNRLRRGTRDSYVPWGLIGGNSAAEPPSKSMDNVYKATNLADQITGQMFADGMQFNGWPSDGDIAAYTHGMIQAIYKAYGLGPSCAPYEIAVGSVTTKMASCLPCTTFMVAQGYPPTAIHLGRGESWAPLYEPYNPQGTADPHEWAVLRDLNSSWRDSCAEYLRLGLKIMDDAHVNEDHQAARDAVSEYLSINAKDQSAASTLILDAITVHDSETQRIFRTLR